MVGWVCRVMCECRTQDIPWYPITTQSTLPWHQSRHMTRSPRDVTCGHVAVRGELGIGLTTVCTGHRIIVIIYTHMTSYTDVLVLHRYIILLKLLKFLFTILVNIPFLFTMSPWRLCFSNSFISWWLAVYCTLESRIHSSPLEHTHTLVGFFFVTSVRRK